MLWPCRFGCKNFSSVTFAKCSRLIPVFISDVFYLFKLRTKILIVCLDEVCEITVTYSDWLLFLIFGARKLEQSGSFHKSCLLVQRNPVSSLIFGECVFFRHVFPVRTCKNVKFSLLLD